MISKGTKPSLSTERHTAKCRLFPQFEQPQKHWGIRGFCPCQGEGEGPFDPSQVPEPSLNYLRGLAPSEQSLCPMNCKMVPDGMALPGLHGLVSWRGSQPTLSGHPSAPMWPSSHTVDFPAGTHGLAVTAVCSFFSSQTLHTSKEATLPGSPSSPT